MFLQLAPSLVWAALLTRLTHRPKFTAERIPMSRGFFQENVSKGNVDTHLGCSHGRGLFLGQALHDNISGKSWRNWKHPKRNHRPCTSQAHHARFHDGRCDHFFQTFSHAPAVLRSPTHLCVCERGGGRRPPPLQEVLRSCHTSCRGFERKEVLPWPPALRGLFPRPSLCYSPAQELTRSGDSNLEEDGCSRTL